MTIGHVSSFLEVSKCIARMLMIVLEGLIGHALFKWYGTGGMGAGKSSLLKEVLGWQLWEHRRREVVTIEADKIKLSDPLFQVRELTKEPLQLTI